MAFSSPLLLDMVNSICNTLGGIYLGAHIQVGDGHSKADGQTNARLYGGALYMKY
jgi:hypothetical protein